MAQIISKNYSVDLDRFNFLCDELLNSKFIVAEIKITKMLKFIANSDVFVEEFEKCLEEFNYEFEYQKAKVPTTDPEKHSRYDFLLPIEATKKVALIFRILYDIDTKRLDLHNFIREFYVAGDEPFSGFQSFLEKIIKPFKNNINYLITGVEAIPEVEVVPIKEDMKLEERYLIDIAEIIKKIHQIIESSDKELKNGQKEEMLIVANGFANSLLTLNPEQILVCWVGLKNTLQSYKKLTSYLKKIQEKLINSGLFNLD